MKYKKVYFGISLTLIAVGIFSLLRWGLKLGVEFTGGTIIEYQFDGEMSEDEIASGLKEQGIEITSFQKSGGNRYTFKLLPIGFEDKEKIPAVLQEAGKGMGFTELRYETVGPTIGPELIKKTIYAVFIAAGSILLYIAYQFKSFKLGVSAILAMLHDSFILIGSFSLLGHFFGAEVDFLFVTAVLTALSFSVHDTIVVFDRIREVEKTRGGPISEIADEAISETMVRSLNNSFTIVFMLLALLLLGGSTVKWFAGALLIGTISGTYSSPFVAVPLLVSWDGLVDKLKLNRIKKGK